MNGAQASVGVSPRSALVLILAFGFCVRAATFQAPLLDQHAWRQADTAAIARAFAEERYNIFYPQVEWRGDAPTGYVETGLELHAFLVASIAKVSTFKLQIGRLLSSVVFLFSCALVWTFTRRRYGTGAGLLSAYLYAFGFPLMLYMERSFMNEALLVCLSLACLVATQSLIAKSHWLVLAGACIAAALVGAIKLPYLVILAPMFGLFLERYGWRGLVRFEPWVVTIVAIVATGLWYRHAHALGEASGLSFGLFNKAFDFELLTSERFYRMVSQRIFRDILGPIGLTGMVAGGYLAFRNRRWCEALGLVAFVAYLALVSRGNLVHNYYQLVMMPIAATVVATGLLFVIDRLPVLQRSYSTSVTTLLVLVALSTTIRAASFHSWFNVPADFQQVCTLGPFAPSPTDRVIIAGSAEPQFLFCLNRKGWVIDDGPSMEADVQHAWEHGARLAIAYAPAGDELARFLSQHGDEIPLMGPIRAWALRPPGSRIGR